VRAIIPGHLYELDNLKGEGTTRFRFYMDPEIHDGMSLDGPSSQEVIRMLIDRVKHLHSEKEWDGNHDIIQGLRTALAGFEARALLRKVEKSLDIEDLPVGEDGHIQLVTK
jgi:hypothetical protein